MVPGQVAKVLLACFSMFENDLKHLKSNIK